MSRVSEHAANRVFRTLLPWWASVAFYGFVFLLTAGTALNASAPPLARLACGSIALAIVAFLVNARRAGIEVHEHELVVRRYFGKPATVPWSEVSSFELVRNGSFNGGVYVAVVLRDGRTLKTQGLVVASPTSANGLALVSQLEASRPSGTP